MNKVVLIGRLTKDPELKFTPGTGTAVASFTLAIDRRVPSKNGQREADFVPVIVWGKQAESSANYLSKGKLAGVSGRIQTRSYDAKDGSKRYVTEIVAEEVQFLEWGNEGGKAANGNPAAAFSGNQNSRPNPQANQGFGQATGTDGFGAEDFNFDPGDYQDGDGDIPF